MFVRLFLLLFFLSYGGMHWYGYRKMRAALAVGRLGRLWLAFFGCAMVVAPLLVRLVERGGLLRVATALAWLGYLWMGFLFLFVVVAGLVDLGRGGWRLAALLGGRSWFPARSAAWPCLVALPLALLLCGYGWHEARQVRLTRLVVRSAKLPPATRPLRIVQLSDLHLGLLVGPAQLERILAVARAARPDLLVVTGDLVDVQADGLAAMAGQFRGFAPRHGAYAVTGNHEYYVGIDQASAFCRAAGLTLLHGQAVAVGDGAVVAGVDDPVAVARGMAAPDQEARLAAGLDRRRFSILLKHRPVAAPASPFDLQLSGHVHGGQIVPFNLATRLAYPVATGLTRLAGGALLYVSRGSGTWGPPLRLLAPPEVTLFEVVPAGPASKESGRPG